MSLLRNALDSIQVGVEDYRLGTPPRMASAVRNFYAGVLLLLKEVLRRASPPGSNDALIWERIAFSRSPGGVVAFRGHGTKTVDVGAILERFGQLGLSLERSPLERLQTIRNQIEHHAASSTPQQVQAAIAATFRLVNHIIVEHLDEVPALILDADAWNAMLQEERLYEEQAERCGSSLARLTGVPMPAERLIESAYCPICSSELIEALEPDYRPSSQFMCRGCGGLLDAEQLILFMISESSYGSRPDTLPRIEGAGLDRCGQCGVTTFDTSHCVCLVCGYEDHNYAAEWER